MKTDDRERSRDLAIVMNNAVRSRTWAVLGILLASAVIDGIRMAIAGDQSRADVPMGVPVVMGLLILYEAITLFWLYKLRDHSEPLPAPWVYANAVVETAAPTAVGFAIALSSDISLRGAALGPPSHLYALFVVLSVLHVRVLVALTAGVASGLGLASIVIASMILEPSDATALKGVPRSLETFSAALVGMTGVAAGVVALRMRGYLQTATREAEGRMRAERDLQTAALIQQSLMPSDPPEVPGFEIVGWNRPADETGGDYFDWVALDDKRYAICVADVTGHGLGPAMITCFCRAYARTALRFETRVATALRRLNSELVDDLGDGRFVTFAAVIVTPNSGRVLSTSAGHGPLLIYRAASGAVEAFNADAIPLGVYEMEEEVEAIAHDLDAGDVFLLLTDGFFEWANASGEQFGTRRLVEAFSRHGSGDAQAVIDGIRSEVESFTGGTPQPDDLTAVVIRRNEDQGQEVERAG
ncbi:MAG: PP2C family protein-serine/threonine phosphatase [Planctomycetota bacterium]